MDDESIREAAIEDAVDTLAEEQPEHWAHNVRDWRDALPSRDDRWLRVWCVRRLNAGDGPDSVDQLWRIERAPRPHDLDLPTPRQHAVYRKAFITAMQAGIAACEEQCDLSCDPDHVIAEAIDAARATLNEESSNYDMDEVHVQRVVGGNPAHTEVELSCGHRRWLPNEQYTWRARSHGSYRFPYPCIRTDCPHHTPYTQEAPNTAPRETER